MLISADALASKILCERHNQALSPCDVTAAAVFTSLRRYQLDFAEVRDIDEDGFTLVSGPLFERWLLKLLWGGVQSKSLGKDGTASDAIREEADQASLLEMLYRGGSLPERWGFYGLRHDPDPLGNPDSVGIRSALGPDGTVWTIQVEFGAISFTFAFGSADAPDAVFRPGGVILTTTVGRGEKILVFAWPEKEHGVLSYTRQGVGPATS